MHIQPARSLTLGDTDIMGSVEFNEKFHVYVINSSSLAIERETNERLSRFLNLV